jgi:uncharacterized protein YqjF (DUF2071 family)
VEDEYTIGGSSFTTNLTMWLRLRHSKRPNTIANDAAEYPILKSHKPMPLSISKTVLCLSNDYYDKKTLGHISHIAGHQ